MDTPDALSFGRDGPNRPRFSVEQVQFVRAYVAGYLYLEPLQEFVGVNKVLARGTVTFYDRFLKRCSICLIRGTLKISASLSPATSLAGESLATERFYLNYAIAEKVLPYLDKFCCLKRV